MLAGGTQLDLCVWHRTPLVNAGANCRRHSAIGAPTHAMALGVIEGDLVLLELLGIRPGSSPHGHIGSAQGTSSSFTHALPGRSQLF